LNFKIYPERNAPNTVSSSKIHANALPDLKVKFRPINFKKGINNFVDPLGNSNNISNNSNSNSNWNSPENILNLKPFPFNNQINKIDNKQNQGIQYYSKLNSERDQLQESHREIKK